MLKVVVIEIRIKKLIWDEWNLEHIKKHKVCQEEVEEAVGTERCYMVEQNQIVY